MGALPSFVHKDDPDLQRRVYDLERSMAKRFKHMTTLVMTSMDSEGWDTDLLEGFFKGGNEVDNAASILTVILTAKKLDPVVLVSVRFNSFAPKSN